MEQQAGARDHHPAMVHLSRNAYGTILRQAYQTLNMVGTIIIQEESFTQWVAQHTFASSEVSPTGVDYRRNCRVKFGTAVGHVACRLILSSGMSRTRIGIG